MLLGDLEQAVSSASRVDGDSGVRVEAGFLDSGEAEISYRIAVPRAPARAGLVVCNPLGVEYPRTYRSQFLLAMSLARRGVAVLRFDYRGTGNSGGDPGGVTFESMANDAAEMSNWFIAKTGIGSTAFLGMRWGALIAAAGAARFPGAPLALWEPVIAAASYFDEMTRARALQPRGPGTRSASGRRPPPLGSAPLEAFGFTLSPRFVTSARTRELISTLGPGNRQVLLAQISWRGVLRAEYREAVACWPTMDLGVMSKVFEGYPWWLPGTAWQQRETVPGHPGLIDFTSTWIREQLLAGRSR